ncbi:MAG TPA: hypothetical protein VNL91_08005 [Thermoanaerobaculia bacterium]|nr:hypothetical protein [Thermoanaerobaculia bacterium]
MRSVCALLLASLAPAAIASSDCRYTADRAAAISLAGAKRIVILAEAGSLRVAGQPGLAEVRASGTACSPERELLDDIRLTATRSGADIRIEATTPEGTGLFPWSHGARLDFSVSVPAELPIVVEDDSGPIRIENVAAAVVDDDSGEIDIRNVRGDVTIRDDSGSIRVVGVGGMVHVEDDDSGEIEIERAGAVRIDDDDSGSIDIRDIRGDVTIRADGSGSIDVRNVGGSFTVERDGSGGIEYENVRGRVRIPEKD